MRNAWSVIASSFTALIFALAFIVVPSVEPEPTKPACGSIALRNFKVIDGDTFRADFILPYGIVLESQVVRCNDYDAWESKKLRRTVGLITDAEVAKGLLAKAALQKLADTKRMTLQPPNDAKRYRDVYGRILGKLFANDESVAEHMCRDGHCRSEPLVDD